MQGVIVQALAEAGSGGGGEAVENLRDGVIEGVAEELQAPFDLVRKAGAFDAQLSGHPEKVDLGFDVGKDVVAFAGGPALGFERDEEPVDAAVDLQDGDALGLGRVGGQRGADREAGGELGEILAGHAGVERGESGGEGAFDGLGAFGGLDHTAGTHVGIFVNDLG